MPAERSITSLNATHDFINASFRKLAPLYTSHSAPFISLAQLLQVPHLEKIPNAYLINKKPELLFKLQLKILYLLLLRY